MSEILEIAKDFAEDLAPHVISQTGTVKTLIMAAVVAYCLNPNKPTFQNMLRG